MDVNTVAELFKAPACADINAYLKNAEDCSEVVAVPDGTKLVSTEAFHPGRLRRRGLAKTSSLFSLRDFVAVNAHPDCLITVDEKEMRVVAYLDYNTVNSAPGHCGFQVSYSPTITADFAEFSRKKNQHMSQQEFAEFFEDNLELLDTDDADGMKLTVLQAIVGIRNFTVKTDNLVTSEAQPYLSKQTSIDKLDAKSANGLLPGMMRFTCVPYLGFTSRTFQCRIRVHLAEKKPPEFSYKVIGYEKHVEEIGGEMADGVKAQLAGLGKIFQGTYNPN
jgi:uncharacterized protein YfdQ (DUF2303 family)